MLEMFINALKLFLRGKLFREPWVVFRQWLIGFSAAALLLALLLWAGVLPGVAVVVTALGSGLLQPWLFRDLKYD